MSEALKQARAFMRHESGLGRSRDSERDGLTSPLYPDGESGLTTFPSNVSQSARAGPALLRSRTGKTLWRLARAKALGVVYISRREVDTLSRTETDGDYPDTLGIPDRTMSVPVLIPSAELGDESEDPGIFNLKNDANMLFHAITGSYMSILLLCVPVGIAAGILKWNAMLTFVLNFFALIPLALLLGEVTEDLALRFGDTIGGLLNATFGNVVELILSIAALSKGLYNVVAASLIGSILSNLLLVLGCCFLFGGVNFQEQSFNALANKASCSLLFMSCISLTIPTASSYLYGKYLDHQQLLHISHGTCIILAIVYCLYLFFQLKTHRELYSGEEESEETPSLSLVGALTMLGLITVIVAIASEYLTGAIEEVSETSGLSEDFLGLIVLPIAGNACEHITAVFVAVKNKMDLSLGVALGSSIQIAIFVIPVVILVGWAIGRPMTLSFSPFLTIILTLSVIHAYFVSSDGRSNWLMGMQLVGTYVLIAIVFFFIHCPPGGCV